MAGRAPVFTHGWFEVRDFEYQAQCPHCEEVLGIIFYPKGAERPEIGWVNLCQECGELGVFEPNGFTMTLRKATEEELAQALQVPGLRLAREEAIARKEASRGAAS